MKIFDDINDYLLIDRTAGNLLPDFGMVKYSDYLNYPITKKLVERYRKVHRRNFFEVIISIKDSSPFSIGGEHFKDIRNSISFVSPTQMFSLRFNYTEEKNADEGFVISFKPSFLFPQKQNFEVLNEFPFFNIHTFPMYRLEKQQLDNIVHLADEMYNEYVAGGQYYEDVLKRYLDILLYSMKRYVNKQYKVLSINRFETITSNFEQEIIASGYNYLSISEYASCLNISAVYLSECVKKATGRSAKQVLLDYKLITAKALLHQSTKSVAEIASKMNFSEPTNFIKFFKKMMGITPKQFRS